MNKGILKIIILSLVSVVLIIGLIFAIKAINFSGITQKEAIKNARTIITFAQLETIKNIDNPKVEEIYFTDYPSIYYVKDHNDILNKKVYKITYNTMYDELIGPIVIYVDGENGDVIGSEVRE